VSTTRHVALLGGLRDAPAVANDAYVVGALIGGVDLDLRRAEVPRGGVVVTKVSFVGGAHVRVPAGCRVEVKAFNLVGRKRVVLQRGVEDGPLVRVRAYGLFGGVRVED
jgi:hypothetical protein